MGDYDYCERHDTSFLMPELLMCPKCAREALDKGLIPEPFGDALLEYCKTLEAQRDYALNAMVAGGIVLEPTIIAEAIRQHEAKRAADRKADHERSHDGHEAYEDDMK
jgi:hypothetical protein